MERDARTLPNKVLISNAAEGITACRAPERDAPLVRQTLIKPLPAGAKKSKNGAGQNLSTR
jgi:hypothetical protein